MGARSATSCKVRAFRSAVETFVRGHCFMKSFAYPYVFERVDGLWVMKDGMGKKPRKQPRRSEVVVFGKSPEAVVEIARATDLGKHFISHMHTLEESPTDIRAAYSALGYRTMFSEEFFTHDMRTIPKFDCKPPVKRVEFIEDSDKIKKHRRNRKPIRDVDLGVEDPEHRLYSVIEGNRAYGWVGSVPFGIDTWIADLFVREEYRGRGYGRALMSRVMQEDKNLGIERSVLLASGAGARLYPHLGYEHIGTLQLFCLKRS